MQENVNLTISNLTAISRLFSSSVFRELATRGKSALFARLVKESRLLESKFDGESVGDLFDAAFAVLRLGQRRDEYVYKAALTHKVLLGKHTLRTACMLNEFRVGECKADLAILNGTATVYEIKSERDSLSRLDRQISAYKKIFPSVVVIAGENHVDAVLECTSSDVGVLQLSKRHQITQLRAAVDRPDRVCPLTVLESVRTNEALEILMHIGVDMPTVPNTMIHAELKKRFAGVRPEDVHVAMVRTLKRTRNLLPLGQLIDQLPGSLQAAALSVPIKKADHDRLVRTVRAPLGEAMGWA